MYTIEEIKELIAALDSSSLTNLEIVEKTGEKLVIKKKIIQQTVAPVQSAPVIAQTIEPQQINSAPAQAAQESAPVEKDDCRVITSPMVGVFYSSPSPEADPYVSVGQSVKSGDVVCIIEAMKLMNEIPATESGTITEICVSNGDVVEYGQPLFKIK